MGSPSFLLNLWMKLQLFECICKTKLYPFSHLWFLLHLEPPHFFVTILNKNHGASLFKASIDIMEATPWTIFCVARNQMKTWKQRLAMLLLFPALLAYLPLTAQTHSFTDVSESTYQDAINYVYDNGIMDGVTTTAFAPGNAVNRPCSSPSSIGLPASHCGIRKVRRNIRSGI